LIFIIFHGEDFLNILREDLQYFLYLQRWLHTFFKKPLYKQPSTRQHKIEETFRTTRKELRNFRQLVHWNCCLVQFKTVSKQWEYDIALELNSQWCILFVIGQIVWCIQLLHSLSHQFSLLNQKILRTFQSNLWARFHM